MVDAERIRLLFFVAVLAVMAGWEMVAPRRRLTDRKGPRWATNLGIIFLDTLVVRFLFPVSGVALAQAAAHRQWGLFAWLPLPPWLEVVLAVLLLDLVVYLQHLLFHAVPLLWRLHMVHHADLDIDVTTGLRFHPVEIAVSMVIKLAAVAALGVPVAAALAFEVVLNATAMFNHANATIPPAVDRWLRLLVVTPDMHRVHHSVAIRETNANFGFNFPWWDRLCGTYRPQPVAGHQGMTIGLAQFRTPLRLAAILLLPVTGDPGRYSLDHIGGDPARLYRRAGGGE